MSPASVSKNTRISRSVDETAGDTIRYVNCGLHCFNSCILKARVRNGKVIAVEPDDTANPGLAREDGKLSREEVDKYLYNTRPCARGISHSRMLYAPERIIYR